jgi:hypothetical protein
MDKKQNKNHINLAQSISDKFENIKRKRESEKYIDYHFFIKNLISKTEIHSNPTSNKTWLLFPESIKESTNELIEYYFYSNNESLKRFLLPLFLQKTKIKKTLFNDLIPTSNLDNYSFPYGKSIFDSSQAGFTLNDLIFGTNEDTLKIEKSFLMPSINTPNPSLLDHLLTFSNTLQMLSKSQYYSKNLIAYINDISNIVHTPITLLLDLKETLYSLNCNIDIKTKLVRYKTSDFISLILYLKHKFLRQIDKEINNNNLYHNFLDILKNDITDINTLSPEKFIDNDQINNLTLHQYLSTFHSTLEMIVNVIFNDSCATLLKDRLNHLGFDLNYHILDDRHLKIIDFNKLTSDKNILIELTENLFKKKSHYKERTIDNKLKKEKKKLPAKAKLFKKEASYLTKELKRFYENFFKFKYITDPTQRYKHIIRLDLKIKNITKHTDTDDLLDLSLAKRNEIYNHYETVIKINKKITYIFNSPLTFKPFSMVYILKDLEEAMAQLESIQIIVKSLDLNQENINEIPQWLNKTNNKIEHLNNYI